MYHQVFFGATCAGILLAAGLMPLPDRSRLPEFSVPDISVSEFSMPDGAAVMAGIEEVVEGLPGLRASFEENVIRPGMDRLTTALARPAVTRAQAPAEAATALAPADATGANAPAHANLPRGMAKTVNFDLDDDRLDDTAKAQLDGFVRQLAAAPAAKLGIYGHTDLTGDAGYNDLLGQSRAEQVAAYLAAQGIARERIEIIKSYGETTPTVATDAASRDNRRVNIEVF